MIEALPVLIGSVHPISASPLFDQSIDYQNDALIRDERTRTLFLDGRSLETASIAQCRIRKKIPAINRYQTYFGVSSNIIDGPMENITSTHF